MAPLPPLDPNKRADPPPAPPPPPPPQGPPPKVAAPPAKPKDSYKTADPAPPQKPEKKTLPPPGPPPTKAALRSELNVMVEDLYSHYAGPVLRQHVKWVPPPAGAPVLAIDPSQSLLGFPASYDAKTNGIPRYPRLTEEERKHETAFANQVEADWPGAINTFYAASKDTKLNTYVFETDAAKKLYAPYGAGKAPANKDEAQIRAVGNQALHRTALAVTREAFLKRLQELKALPDNDPHRSVFVTNGGCGAGKGSLTDLLRDRNGGKFEFGAVWDAAGEAEATDNMWILEQCKAAGLKVVFGYCDNDPMQQYQDVMARSGVGGRYVDPVTFARSYTRSAANMRAFLQSPEYLEMHAHGQAEAIGLHTGKFDTRHLTEPGKYPSYPDAKPLGKDGMIEAADIPAQPPARKIIAQAMSQLDKWREQNPNAPWLVPCTINPLKFGGL